MTLEKALQIITGNQEDDEAEKFLKFLSENCGACITHTLWTR